jgi:FkbM family methyltransferase
MRFFFDIGANIGSTFDRYLLKTQEFDGAHVFCFEPSPRSWPQLLIKAEEMSHRFKVTVCPFGLDGQWGAWPFYEQTISEGDTFIKDSVAFTNEPAIPLGVNYRMMAATMSLTYMIFTNTTPSDKVFLKLDCEGAEYAILKDLIYHEDALARCDRILVEWHNVLRIDFKAEEAMLCKAFAAAGHPLENWPY